MPVIDDLDTQVVIASAGGTVTMDGTTMRVESLGSAQVQWRTQVATSPYVKGAALISAVRDVTEVAVGIVCDGNGSHAAAQALVDAIGAATSVEGTIAIQVDDVTITWACWPASMDAPLVQEPYYWHGQRLVRLTVPVQPDPAIS
jgi:hypothetical protein